MYLNLGELTNVQINLFDEYGYIISSSHIKLKQTLVLLSFLEFEVLSHQLLPTLAEEGIPNEPLIMHGE